MKQILFSILLILMQIGHAQVSSTFTLVELFTSQGCSSCPPADEVLSDLITAKNIDGTNVYALSYHVDYWNYLGWKDPYSQKEFSARQRKYANALRSSVYTPQMVFNGSMETVGSRKKEVIDFTKKASVDSHQNLSISIQTDEKYANLEVSYAFDKLEKNQILNIALVEKNLEDAIKRGENRGATLHHDNVVRFFQTIEIPTTNGKMNIKMPEVKNIKNTSIIAFLQNETSLQIMDACEMMIISK